MNAEVVVVGGGLAGVSAALTLRRSGFRVVLLEREAQPHHKVCGEFLSAEALRYLAALGIDVASHGAVPVRRVRLLRGAAVTETSLPFAAMSLTRRTLDAALLAQASAAGVLVHAGHTLEGLQRDGDGWLLRTTQGDWRTGAVVLATGKHDLRGRPRPAGSQAGMMGLKMYFRLAADQRAALGDAVELASLHGAYAGLQPVEDGCANFCCTVHADAYRSFGGTWEGLFTRFCSANALLAQRLIGAQPQLAKPLAVSPVPYGYVRSATERGLWCVGDQAAVIPSFTGDGMSMALHSGVLAATMLAQGESAEAFQQKLAADVRSLVGLATTIATTLATHPRLTLALAQRVPGLLRTIARRTRLRDKDLLA